MFKIPVLTYHHVVPADAAVAATVCNSPFTVNLAQFREQMEYLRMQQYHTLSFADIAALLNGKADAALQKKAQRAVAITFDDGWCDNYEQAFPVMVEAGIRATLFMISREVGRRGFVTAGQLREMQANGVQIASHTHSHQPLELLDEVAVLDELQQSKTLLSDVCGQPVSHLSFPHGSYNRRVLRLAQRFYEGIGTSAIGFVTARSSALEVPRIMMRSNHTLADFTSMCRCETGHIVKAAAVQKLKHTLKNAIGLKNYMRLHSRVYGTTAPVFEYETVDEAE